MHNLKPYAYLLLIVQIICAAETDRADLGGRLGGSVGGTGTGVGVGVGVGAGAGEGNDGACDWDPGASGAALGGVSSGCWVFAAARLL